MVTKPMEGNPPKKTMTLHADILDTRESLKGGFWASVSLHGTLIAIAVVYTLINANTTQIGDANAGGSAVGVEVAKSIPLQHHGPQNPVANDTQSEVPQTPAPPVVRKQMEKAPPPDAIPIRAHEEKKKPAKVASAAQQFRPYKELDPNQLTSKAAPQVSSPLYSAQAGSGRIGPGANTTLGSRCGAYSAQIQSTGGAALEYRRRGPAHSDRAHGDRDFRSVAQRRHQPSAVLQDSCISALDFSVQRAILDASPFPPMPSVHR